jgi:hypothetical protein
MTESGDTDPTAPKEMQQNPPNPAGEGGDRDEEAGERALTEDEEFVEELESDPARAGSHSPGEDLIGG